MPKPLVLQSNHCFCKFLNKSKNRCEKEPRKSYFWINFRAIGATGSIMSVSGVDLNGIGKIIKIVQISIKSTAGAQRTDTRRNTDPRLVYLDEGRDPGEGEGGGDPPPPSRGREIETRRDR